MEFGNSTFKTRMDIFVQAVFLYCSLRKWNWLLLEMGLEMGLKGALFVYWFFLAVVRGSWAEECVRFEGEPACVCHTSAGIVDLRPLANTDGTPM